MKKIVVIAGIVLGLIGFGLWFYSDKNVVERKSQEFVQSFEKEEGDGLITGVISENNFINLLDKRVAFNLEHRDMPDMPNGIKHDREKLGKSYLYVMRSAKLIKITDPKVEILEINNDTAKVSVALHGEVKHSSYSINSDLSVLLDFKKTDEGWRISVVTVKRKE